MSVLHGVSVIIPAYNCAEYIGAAIYSVLQQSYTGNIEIIVVNDGSTDDIHTALLPFRDRNIQVIDQKNRGVSAARNRGVSCAKFNWIAFLDADDVWKSNKLQLQMDVVNQHPYVKMVFTEFSACKENSDVFLDYAITSTYPIFRDYNLDWDSIFCFKPKTLPHSDIYTGSIFTSLFLGNFILTSSVLISRTAFDISGGFDPLLRTEEDYDLWLRVSKLYDICFINEPLLVRRHRPNQLTNRSQLRYIGENSLRIIEKTIPEVKTLLPSSLIRRRVTTKKYAVGIVLFSSRDFRRARDLFWHAWVYNPSFLKSFIFFLFTFFPSFLSDFLIRFLQKK